MSIFNGEDMEALRRELLRTNFPQKNHIKVNKLDAMKADPDNATPEQLIIKSIAENLPQWHQTELRRRKR